MLFILNQRNPAMSNAKPSSLDARLLTDLHRFLATQTAKHIPTEQLLDYLAGIDAAPWATLVQGKAITARHLARLLQPHGIFPKTIRFTDGLAKGYTVADFADAFARSFVTDKVADIVHVTDRKPVVAAPIPTPPARNWPPRKGWVWNHQTKSYEPPTPTVQSEPMDQETIRQTLHVSPHLKYVPGYGLTTV